MPVAGVVKVTTSDSPGFSSLALAMTRVSSVGIQSLYEYPIPAVATASLVPSWTSAQLCCWVLELLVKVKVTLDPAGAESESLLNNSSSPLADPISRLTSTPEV